MLRTGLESRSGTRAPFSSNNRTVEARGKTRASYRQENGAGYQDAGTASIPDFRIIPLRSPGARPETVEWKYRMKARVTVSFKKSILDPQGQTIRSALAGRGYEGILDVRQGKVFEIEIGKDVPREQAQKNLEEIARDILANPVIEDYRVELAD